MPDLIETMATPAILLTQLASPPEHACANEKMLLHRVVPCVAVDPMLTTIRFPGQREGSGGRLVDLDRPRQTEGKPGIGSRASCFPQL